MVEVNLLGTFQVTQVIGGAMAARGEGSVINIGSLYAAVSPDQRLYDHLPGDLPFLKSPGIRRVEGRGGEHDEVLRHAVGPLGRPRECAVAWWRAGRAGRSVQGKVHSERSRSAGWPAWTI